MPKINYARGETRESVRRRDPGVMGRKRYRAWGKKHRTRRGHGGLLKDYYPLLARTGIRHWCPCCIDQIWSRAVRNAGSRQTSRRLVHKTLRREGKRICRLALTGFGEDRER